MTGNEYQKLAMRDRMPAKKNSDKLDLLEFCKSKLKTRYTKGFDIEKSKSQGQIGEKICQIPIVVAVLANTAHMTK